MGAPLLLSVPDELIAVIVSLVDLDSILSLALACKETYRHTVDRLRSNQQWHAQYRVQHDRLPLTVPSLLRLALDERDEISHVRSFDSWGLRPGFAKWTTWDWEDQAMLCGMEAVNDWPEPAENHSHLDESFFKLSEWDAFRSIMADTFHMDAKRVDEWMGRIREGWDEPLKGMLFALAPKLDRLNFIAYDSWQSYEFHEDHPLTFLYHAIVGLLTAQPVGTVWPAGFQSLRTISVCTGTNLRHPHEAYYAPAYVVFPLFVLPNIKVLRLTLLNAAEDDDDDDSDGDGNATNSHDFALPVASSTVEELELSCCSMAAKDTIAMLSAPRKLVRLTAAATPLFQDGPDSVSLMKALLNHKDSIEELSLDDYGPDSSMLKQFPRLKVLHRLPLQRLTKQEDPFTDVTFREAAVGDEDKGTGITVAELRSFLPTTLERIHFERDLYPQYMRGNGIAEKSCNMRAAMLEAIADLVEDEAFSSVKEVCLMDLPDYTKQKEREEMEAEETEETENQEQGEGLEGEVEQVEEEEEDEDGDEVEAEDEDGDEAEAEDEDGDEAEAEDEVEDDQDEGEDEDKDEDDAEEEDTALARRIRAAKGRIIARGIATHLDLKKCPEQHLRMHKDGNVGLTKIESLPPGSEDT